MESWKEIFSRKEDNYQGSVSSSNDLHRFISVYETSTNSKFNVFKKDRLFGKEAEIDLCSIKLFPRFEDTQGNTVPKIPSTGVPFVIIGKKVFDCHQEIDRNKSQKRRAHERDDHSFKKHRRHVQVTKKLKCPVQIKVRHIIRFPEYGIAESVQQGSIISKRDSLSLALKKDIAEGKNISLEHEYHVSLPRENDHRNHVLGEAASMTQPPDERVKAFIRQMVFENDVRSTTHMRLLLENNNRNNIFKGRALPPKTNSRFWPSKKTIRNHIALAIVSQRHSNNDQVALEELVTRWKDEYPQDNF